MKTSHCSTKSLRIVRVFCAAALLLALSVFAAAQTNTFPASGNVGIGTTNPSTKLQVQQDVNGDNSIQVLNNGGGTLSRSLILFGEAASDAKYAYFGHFGSNYAGSGPAQPRSTLLVGADAGGFNLVSFGGLSQTGGKVGFWTSPDAAGGGNAAVAERMRITSYGHVGIGTTSPGSLLQIANAAQPTFTVETTGTTAKGRVTAAVPDWVGLTQNARFDGSNWNLDNTSVPGWLLKLDSRGWADVFEIARFSSGTNPRAYTPLFTIDSGGDVGIGTNTSNVAYKLDVNGAINATALNVNGSPVNGSQWANSSGNINYTSGNVGIGTTTPAAKLDVQGNFSVTGGGTNDTVKVLSTSSLSGGTYIQNTQASAQAISYVENNRGSYASYGGFLYGGSSNALGNLFGLNRADKMFLFADGVSNQGMAVGTLAAQPLILGTSNAERIRVDANGKVGIGTSNPEEKLHVAGSIKVDGNINAKYQDLAEWVPSSEQLSAGTVVVLDTTKSNQVISSNRTYDTRVAGVISAQPGITLGEGGEGKVLVATTGRVRVKVDASRGPIQIGDLLVTSDVAGVAMKSEAVNLGGVEIHRPGTIIGKALEPLAKGSGEILVLLSLQ